MGLDAFIGLLMQQDATTAIAEATTEAVSGEQGLPKFLKFVGVLALIFVPYFLGKLLARRLRARDIDWQVGIICSVLVVSTAIVATGRPTLGVDLRGGSNLIYEVDMEQTAMEKGASGEAETSDPAATASKPVAAIADGLSVAEMDGLIDALSRRINPSGVREIVLRPYGQKRVELIIPEVNPAELEQIKRQIVSAGLLRFRILADSRRDRHVADLKDTVQNSGQHYVRDAAGAIVAEWIRIARDRTGSSQELGAYKMIPPDGAVTRELQPGALELLSLHPDDRQNIVGDDLGPVRKGIDENARWGVFFSLNEAGAQKMGVLTQMNLPTSEGRFSHLGIVMDNELISAPRIQSRIVDRGQITGNFTEAEVDELVTILNAGRLPVVLKKEPISDNRISSLLGEDTQRQGRRAIVMGGVAVVAFMVMFYRFAGVVACLALALNLILTVAFAILISAAFTLPGLAGLVLTIGMSVDANVLIFERIREELARGATLRIAIRNGFARATTTIVDAQLTSLITAIVLYAIGTDALRGFAIILILGIVTSLFTAITVSRVIFEISERNGWIKKLSMMQLFGATKVDFIGKWAPALAISVVFIVAGLIAAKARGKQLFDIDFTGGSSVQVALNRSVPIETVRAKLEGISDSYSVASIDVAGREDNSTYRIDCSLDDVEKLRQALQDRLAENSESWLQTHSMQFAEPTEVVTAPSTPPAATGAPGATGGTAPTTPPSSGTPSAGTPSTGAANASASAAGAAAGSAAGAGSSAPPTAGNEAAAASSSGAAPAEQAEVNANDLPSTEKGAETAPAPPEPAATEPAAPTDAGTGGGAAEQPAGNQSSWISADGDVLLAQAGDASKAVQDLLSGLNSTAGNAASTPPPILKQTKTKVTFDEPINSETLKREFREMATELNLGMASDIALQRDGWSGSDAAQFKDWNLTIPLEKEAATQLLTKVSEKMKQQPVWLSSSTFGGAVAGNMQITALKAIVVSLFGIVLYVWVRFQNIFFGLAAVLALLHDALAMIAAVALSHWLVPGLSALLIEDFRISLPVIAAVLTIMGYSVNDTIVVFDRLREVRGRSPHITGEMINVSLNQTLNRTLLTALTTLLVVVVLYLLGGPGIHGFAFVLLVGVVAGTYSSIYIACPILLWVGNKKETQGKGPVARAKATA